MAKRTCSVEGCALPVYATGWCEPHYARARRNGGDPGTKLVVRQGRPAEERFWEKVDRSGLVPSYRPDLGPCWLWTGATNRKGYGDFRFDNKNCRAHRVSLFLTSGEWPADDLEVDHLCRVRACVNPAHLEAVTQYENQARGLGTPVALAKTRTHCKNGHEFTPENTFRRKRGRGCRACGRAANNASYARAKARG